MRLVKSTTFLALVCLLLAGATGFSIWWGLKTYQDSVIPSVEGAAVAIGLPGGSSRQSDEHLLSQSAVWWDSETGSIRYAVNGFEERPIASITKLMTAMVALDYGFDWDKKVEILPEEYVVGGQLLLHPGEFVTMRDLMYASLLGSANNATLAYVRALDVPEIEFVQAMNRKAIELGLENTRFVEVTGLDVDNISTAYEVARLAEAAWETYPDIAAISGQNRYVYTVGGSGREHTILNTNDMITEQGYTLGGSKTGYLDEAGFCLVVRGSDEDTRHIVVVLGAPSEWDSIADVKTLFSNVTK